MPEAPVPAAQRALAQAGLGIDADGRDQDAQPVRGQRHLFRARHRRRLARINNYGCSLVWGHPQAPMGTRAIIELIEELALRGGGYGLFTGCAAGDTAMAVVLEVADAYAGGRHGLRRLDRAARGRFAPDKTGAAIRFAGDDISYAELAAAHRARRPRSRDAGVAPRRCASPSSA